MESDESSDEEVAVKTKRQCLPVAGEVGSFLSDMDIKARKSSTLMTLGNQICMHDGHCFRRNHQHFLDFCHENEQKKPRCPALLRLEACKDTSRSHVCEFTHCPTMVELDRVQRGLTAFPQSTTTTTNTTNTTTSTTTTMVVVDTGAANSVPALPQNGGKLRSSFVAPPFSILDAKQGPWQARKREWLAMGIDSGAGRDDGLLGAGLAKLSPGLTGTSIFDPVLAECAFTWYAPRAVNGAPPVICIDPFAGGSVRGIVAAKLGLQYFGVDLSGKQIDANRAQAIAVCGDCTHQPTWAVGDGKDIVSLFARFLAGNGLAVTTKASMLLTCPPYYDLECYGGDVKKDLSMMSFDDFVVAYRRILAESTSLLDTYGVSVVTIGNVRSSSGQLRDLHSITKTSLEDSGNVLYADAVLATALASAPQRAGRQMNAASKLVGVHQNVVVTCKTKPLTTAVCAKLGIRAGS